MAAASRERWSSDHFAELSWHDVHVHGFRLIEGGDGTAELVLDIDFILEWLPPEEGRYRFRVAQAMLQFHRVFGLRFALDYAVCSAGMCAFSIVEIEREAIETSSEEPMYRWRIEVNWPEGRLEFESPGFSQWLVGESRVLDRQSLPSDQRI